MLKKMQFIHLATAIGIAIGVASAPIVSVRANPSLPTNERQSISAPQPAINSPTNSPPPTLPNQTTPSQPAPNNPTPSNPAPVAFSPKIDTISGVAETTLVEHLANSDVTFYGAYWCPHCQKQKSLFGAAAAAKLPYVECAANAENSQRQLCKDKNIKMFPTWVVKGKFYPGIKDLKEIAAMTGYKGPTNFQYHK